MGAGAWLKVSGDGVSSTAGRPGCPGPWAIFRTPLDRADEAAVRGRRRCRARRWRVKSAYGRVRREESLQQRLPGVGASFFLIFAPSPEDDRYVDQRRLLEGARGGFAERDLLRGDLCERETGTFDGGPVSVEHAAWAWERYGVEPGRFAAVLVGKDGTVKLRSDKPVEPDGLYALIDEMPMRRREMRERGG